MIYLYFRKAFQNISHLVEGYSDRSDMQIDFIRGFLNFLFPKHNIFLCREKKMIQYVVLPLSLMNELRHTLGCLK